MLVEIVGLMVVFVGVSVFGIVAWRLTLHVIGVDPRELAMLRTRFQEWRTPETQLGMDEAVPPVSTVTSGAAGRVERILAQLDDKPELH